MRNTNTELSNIDSNGGIPTDYRAEDPKGKHAYFYIDMSAYVLILHGHAQVDRLRDRRRCTQTDAKNQACTSRQSTFGDISRHSQTRRGRPTRRALRSYVLDGTGSEGPQQETYAETMRQNRTAKARRRKQRRGRRTCLHSYFLITGQETHTRRRLSSLFGDTLICTQSARSIRTRRTTARSHSGEDNQKSSTHMLG